MEKNMNLPFKKIRIGVLSLMLPTVYIISKTGTTIKNAIEMKKGTWKEVFDSEFLAK